LNICSYLKLRPILYLIGAWGSVVVNALRY